MLWTLLLFSCRPDVSSPPSGPLSVTPNLVCNDQLTTPVHLAGSGLSATGVDALSDKPGIQIPDLWLRHSYESDGSASDSVDLDLDESTTAVRWLGQGAMEFDVFPELAATSGVYDVFAQNADGELGIAPYALTVVPPPVLDGPVPELVCNAQSDTELTLNGTGFLQVDGVMPAIQAGTEAVFADALDDCFGLGGPVDGLSCNTLDLTIDRGTLEPGVHDLVVTNPDPATCASTQPVAFEAVMAPVLDDVSDGLVCTAQFTNTLTLSGEGFVVLADGTTPNLDFGGSSISADSAEGCTDLSGPAGGQSCTTLLVEIPVDFLAADIHSVVVTNPFPADCISTEPVEIQVIDPPALTQVVADLVCDDQGDVGFTLTGSGFLVNADGVVPTISMGTYAAAADTYSDCVDLQGPDGGQLCSTLTFTLPSQTLGEGLYDVVVTNPDTAACSSTESIQVQVVPPPVVEQVEPNLVCDAQGNVELTVSGSGFLVLADGTLPTVDLGGTSVTADSADACADLTGPAGGWSCGTLVATLPADALGAGVYDTVVTNPEPAACVSTETVQFEVVPEPTLDTVDPNLFCDAEGNVGYTLSGSDFLVLADGTLPTVSMGEYVALADSASGCEDLAGPAGGESCTTLAFTLPAETIGQGVVDVFVTNPAPADCSTEAAVQVEAVPPPVLSAVEPDLECDAEGDVGFTLSGTGFVVLSDGTLPTVDFGGYSASADGADGCADLAGPAGGQSCSALSFTLPQDTLGAGVYSVYVTNPSTADCTSSEAVQFQLVPPPTVAAVDIDLFCDVQEDTELLVSGSDFLVLQDGSLPVVEIGGVAIDVLSADGCEALAGPSGGYACTELYTFVQVADLGADVHGVVVTNPGDAACTSTDELLLQVVTAPTLASITEELECDDQGDTHYVLAGSDFVVLADGTLPAVTIGDYAAMADAASGCTDLTGPGGGQSCTGLDFSVPAGLLGEGIYDVSVTNPITADCGTSEPLELEIVPVPSLLLIEPNLFCDAQGDTSFTLTGIGFVQLDDGTLPAVTMGSYTALADAAAGCTDLAGPAGGSTCTELSFTLPQDTLGEGIYDVWITNPDPAECVSTEAVQVEIVPPPVLTIAEPLLSCDDQGDTVYTLTGDHFVELADGTLPTVDLGTYTAMAETIGGCTALLGPAGGYRCTELTLTLPQGTLADGVHNVVVTNPAPADCSSEEDVEIEVVPPPQLSTVEPELACNEDGEVSYTLTGVGFVELADGTLPQVEIGGFAAEASGASSCTSLAGPGGGSSCSELAFTLPAGSLGGGIYDVYVTNPEANGCTSEEAVQVELTPAPEITTLTPAGTCDGHGDEDVTIEGSGFLVLADGTRPSVTIDGDSYTINAITGCTDLSGPGGGQTCTGIEITILDSDFGLGTYDVVVTNPAPADCASTGGTWSVTEPPVITSIFPEESCVTGGTIEVYGSGFSGATEVSFEGTDAVSVTYIDSGTLLVEVPAGLTSGEYYDVTVDNPGGCGGDTLPSALLITGVPSVFYVDPPVVYTGVQFQATVYISGVEDVGEVWIEESATGSLTSLEFSHTTDSNILTAVIPSGLNEGDYNLYVASDIGCSASLDDAFYAEVDLSFTVDNVDPAFGWTNEATPVEITGSGFIDLPRLYLNPTSATADTTATLLRSVRYRDTDLLNAVIPAGLDPNTYDLIVINPDGTIGLLSDAFTVTSTDTPIVDSVAPASLSTSDGSAVIYGENFSDPIVDMDCVLTSGATASATATVSSSTSTTISVTFPSSSFSNGDVCVVRVTNDNGSGAYFDYSAVSITSPSFNLYGFSTTSAMNVARRAPMVSAGRATTVERYLYVLGGDSGTTASALDSVERVDIDRYGAPGSWLELSDNPLPEPKTMAGLGKIGRFFYAVGGHDGTSSTDTVFRAQVLDPQQAPDFDSLNMEYADGVNGLAAGTWIYRVASLYPASYESNPSGESLAGDPIVVNVPDVPDLIELTINWTEDPDADGYRIYRSPAADAASGSEEWLADVSGGSILEYTDLNGSTDPTVTPLPDGSLGQWLTLPSLNTDRYALAVAVGEDPTEPGRYYIYAIGGRSGTTALSSIEYLRVDVVDEHEQDYESSWTTASRSLSVARYELGAWKADDALNPAIPSGETWIYMGSGYPQTGNIDTVVEAAEVQAGGQLGTISAVDSMNKRRAGYATAIASSQLYAFGGHNGGPVTSADSTEIIGPPDLSGWNAGISMQVARYLSAAAQESANIYVVGGTTDTRSATSEVEYGPW